jgi:hypothetical protein
MRAMLTVPGILPGGKDDRCVVLTTLPPSCADCLEILEPQPSGTQRAPHLGVKTAGA